MPIDSSASVLDRKEMTRGGDLGIGVPRKQDAGTAELSETAEECRAWAAATVHAMESVPMNRRPAALRSRLASGCGLIPTPLVRLSSLKTISADSVNAIAKLLDADCEISNPAMPAAYLPSRCQKTEREVFMSEPMKKDMSALDYAIVMVLKGVWDRAQLNDGASFRMFSVYGLSAAQLGISLREPQKNQSKHLGDF
jgi:hypothetical protein